MRKFRRMLVCLTVVAGVLFVILYQSEPRHQGRTLSHWLDRFNQPESLHPDSASSRAIRAIGAKAVPYLVSNIHTQQVTLWRGFLVRLQSGIGIDLGFDRGRNLVHPSMILGGGRRCLPPSRKDAKYNRLALSFAPLRLGGRHSDRSSTA